MAANQPNPMIPARPIQDDYNIWKKYDIVWVHIVLHLFFRSRHFNCNIWVKILL